MTRIGCCLDQNLFLLKWAHPISTPEIGCLLVATGKLDGVRNFERTLVLLLAPGTKNPQAGPSGIILNRPLHKKMKNMNPSNIELATTFADCHLHFGGLLDASLFMLKVGETIGLAGLEEVMPAVYLGYRNTSDEASGLVKKGTLKPRDIRFFMGYAGREMDELREEIESEYWYVAARSANLIFWSSQNDAASSDGLWEEILIAFSRHLDIKIKIRPSVEKVFNRFTCGGFNLDLQMS